MSDKATEKKTDATETPRNAGAQQTQHQSAPAKELTKRNAEYMRSMEKSLAATKLSADKQQATLTDMRNELLAKQRSGATARQLFGTVQEKTDEIIKGPVQQPKSANYWVTSLDNGLMLFMIFTLLYGVVGLFNSQAKNQGADGIVGILLISIIGGLGVAKLIDYLQPGTRAHKNPHPMWKRIFWSVFALLVWMFAFLMLAALPQGMNPTLPAIAYLVLAALTFGVRLWLKRRYNITSSFF